MLSKVKSFGLSGLEGFMVTVEVDVSASLPACEIVGLPDAAVRESKERVRSAIKNSGFDYPVGRITVNLAPADMKKEGSVYDLPIALGIISATGQLKELMPDCIYLGELALDGSIRGIHGILPMVISASAQGCDTFVVPSANAPETSYISSVTAYGAASLREAVDIINSKGSAVPWEKKQWSPKRISYHNDFEDIRGQYGAKRAAEIAAAGGHNMLML